MSWLKISALLALLWPACSPFKADVEHEIGNSDAGASNEGGAAGAAAGDAAVSGEAGASGDPGFHGEAGTNGEAGAAGALDSGGSSGNTSTGTSGGGGLSSGGACQISLCSAGKIETATQPCGACETGKQTRTRACSADQCSWSAWSAWSTCAGVTAACTPGQTTACANGDSCGQRVCSNSCTWGSCEPKVAGGCLRIRAGHTDEGSNYRCCGSAGHWQFCNSSCKWNTSCASCAKGSPDYCTECY